MTRHGLGSVPTGPSLALVASPLDVIFQNKSFFRKRGYFPKGECLWGQPPLLVAYGGCVDLVYVP